MVLGWLKKLLGKDDVNAPVKSPMGSTHTMGPEELLTMEQEEALEPHLEEIAPADHTDHSHARGKESQWRTRDNGEDEHADIDAHVRQGSTSKEDATRIMEGALFMAGKGMSVEELGKIANVPLLKARQYIPELVDSFNARESALEIMEDVGGYRMKVRSPFDEKVAGLAGVGELNPAEMKTLAFIAYKQPLLQSQLVQVRSNTAYEHLQVLVEKGFVSREPKGRSYILRTTKKFSEYFGTHALKLKPMVKETPETKPDHSQAEEYS